MSYDITITPPLLMPDVQEPVVSFANCPGNMMIAVKDLTGFHIKDMDSNQAINALVNIIDEIDKGDVGRFNNSYAVLADKLWSDGVETTKEWDKIKHFAHTLPSLPYHTYEEFCGYTMRSRIRETSIRFLLYYKAGYLITYQN